MRREIEYLNKYFFMLFYGFNYSLFLPKMVLRSAMALKKIKNYLQGSGKIKQIILTNNTREAKKFMPAEKFFRLDLVFKNKKLEEQYQ